MTDLSLRILSSPELSDEHRLFLEDRGLDWDRPEPATPAELLIEFSGRVCYMAFGQGRQSPRNNRDYVRHLIESGHESVLEHAAWSFILSGISRAFSHQLVRHRAGFSYSQLSQQYHDETDANFVLPAGIAPNTEAYQKWADAVAAAKAAYKELLSQSSLLPNASKRESLRAIRSAARSVLPNATETVIVVTANARSLRHFLRVRGNTIGDVEMRVVSALMLRVFQREAPSVFEDFVCEHLADGFPVVRYVGRN